MKIHSGSDKELMTALSMYGIKGDHLLYYVSGNYQNTTLMEDWLDDRYLEERKRTYGNQNRPMIE
jgi:hypothetical protein